MEQEVDRQVRAESHQSVIAKRGREIERHRERDLKVKI